MENWRLKAKAVTKYNPINYNSEGAYTLDEWTSRSDIGKRVDSVTNTILSHDRYMEVENNYINSVKIFLEEVKAKKFRIEELYKISDLEDFEKNNDQYLYEYYNNLESNEYSLAEVGTIVKLALREYIQVEIKLITLNKDDDTAIYFGYDYYMYFVIFVSYLNHQLNYTYYNL